MGGRTGGFWRETAVLLFQSKMAVCFSVLLLILGVGAVLIPLLAPFDYAAQNVAFSNRPFFSVDPITGGVHLFGTDNLGRDIFVRIWYGARVSLSVAVVVAVIDSLIGVIYGGISGYAGGRTDNVMMRILEVISGIPYMIVVLLLMAMLPQGVGTLILAYSLVGWTGTARLVRGQVLSLKEREFIVSARIMGAGAGRIIFTHLLPNLMGLIIVQLTLDIPGVIFTEAFLSMLGMGVPPPYPSLGMMASDGIAVFQLHPLQLAVPAAFICMIMLAFNLLGDRLQDILNPRLRRGVYGKRDTEN